MPSLAGLLEHAKTYLPPGYVYVEPGRSDDVPDGRNPVEIIIGTATRYKVGVSRSKRVDVPVTLRLRRKRNPGSQARFLADLDALLSNTQDSPEYRLDSPASAPDTVLALLDAADFHTAEIGVQVHYLE